MHPRRGVPALFLMVLVATTVLATAGGAYAGATGDYPPSTQATIEVDATTLTAGSCTTITATGYMPDSPVKITIDGVYYKTVDSSATGVVFTAICFAPSDPGEEQVCSWGITPASVPLKQCLEIDVLGEMFSNNQAGADFGGGLPFTGADVESMLAVAGGFAVAGIVFLRSARRVRRRRASP